jgi:tetratricopeptide (TPR) repeat protein
MMNRQQRRADKKSGLAKPPEPQSVEARFAAAFDLHQAGRLNDAARHYRDVLASHPFHADAVHMLGMVAYQQRRFEEAIMLIGQALGMNDSAAHVHFNMARALEDAGRPREAVESYRRTVTLAPDNTDAYANLGNLLQALGDSEAAVHAYREAIRREPGFAEAHTNLGNLLRAEGELEAALRHSYRAVALAPHFAGNYVNLGATLAAMGKGAEAAGCYRRAIALQPDLAAAHHNLALNLLASGDMATGWPEYEWRWRTQRMRMAQRTFKQPLWRGEAAAGKTLLIHAEQGLGDSLQFCRYVPLAAARGLNVIVQVQKPLARLLADLPGATQLIAGGEAPPRFDLHIPMLSLPGVFGTRLDTIPPPISLLRAGAAEVELWSTRLAAAIGAGPRVGLAWAGSPQLIADRERSIDPAQLAALSAVSGVQFVSLQKAGPQAPAELPLFDAMAEMEDLADTAALIANLDLVISVDTAVAHLAAGLGKPVWLLNRFDGCWRWLQGRTDSPWYPSVTILRQPRPGDWAAVLAEVTRRLQGQGPPGTGIPGR